MIKNIGWFFYIGIIKLLVPDFNGSKKRIQILDVYYCLETLANLVFLYKLQAGGIVYNGFTNSLIFKEIKKKIIVLY